MAMASIKNLFFPTLLGILLLNCGAKAKDMTDFIETFSGICFQSLANFDNARAILRYQGWKKLDDEAISTLGRPADPNAIVEGYAISTSSQQNAYLLALHKLH